jgi:Mn2+/Fe2+ NRAMP family transporter
MPRMTSRIPEPPRGFDRLKWLGPGFLWMVSAAGSGELLFTPRVGAMYGYALLWAMTLAVMMKWFINREIGRYAVCTGKPILEGFATLNGPKNWAVWLILVPQLVVAVAAIAGLAGSAATALILVLPGDVRLWMVVSVLASTALVVFGRYRIIEVVATVIGVALAVAAIAAAVSVAPDAAAIAGGLRPQFPDDVDYAEVLPWLGFMLSGAAGMIWYSHWVVAKGYGAARGNGSHTKDDVRRLRGWLTQMTLDNTVAVVGTFIITAAFLVLGTELLGAKGLVPDEDKVASVLGEMLGGIWGPVGFWFMILCVFVGFWDTVLSDQDGHGRMFAGGTRLILRSFGVRERFANEVMLRRLFVVVLVTVLPIGLYLAVGQPVNLLKIAGAVEAVHIPIVAGLTLYLNRRALPRELWPTPLSFWATIVAAAFFVAFAGLYALQLTR